jgi:hypothetical protein
MIVAFVVDVVSHYNAALLPFVYSNDRELILMNNDGG